MNFGANFMVSLAVKEP